MLLCSFQLDCQTPSIEIFSSPIHDTSLFPTLGFYCVFHNGHVFANIDWNVFAQVPCWIGMSLQKTSFDHPGFWLVQMLLPLTGIGATNEASLSFFRCQDFLLLKHDDPSLD